MSATLPRSVDRIMPAEIPTPVPAYKRILLKLSGEALLGDDNYGINR